RHTRSKRDWSSDVCSSDLHVGRDEQLQCKEVGFLLVALTGVVGAQHAGLAADLATSTLVDSRVVVLIEDQRAALQNVVAQLVGRSEERRVGKATRTRLATS